jgi:hypothetical protein
MLIKSRKVRYTGYVEYMGKLRNGYILVGKLEEKRPFKRVRHSWDDNITMNIQEMQQDSLDQIRLTQNGDQ